MEHKQHLLWLMSRHLSTAANDAGCGGYGERSHQRPHTALRSQLADIAFILAQCACAMPRIALLRSAVTGSISHSVCFDVRQINIRAHRTVKFHVALNEQHTHTRRVCDRSNLRRQSTTTDTIQAHSPEQALKLESPFEYFKPCGYIIQSPKHTHISTDCER